METGRGFISGELTIMKPCPLCQKEVRESENKKQIRCVNKGCTASYLKIDAKKFNEGLLNGFVKFWEVYPRKTSKSNTLKAWIKLSPDTDLFTTIVKSVVAHKFESVQWKNIQYIPYPDSWIRGRCWENEILREEPVQSKPQFNQPPMGYTDKKQKDIQSTPRTKELTKDIIQLTKVMLKVAGKKEKEKILEQIADKQTEIERELARTD